MFSNPCSRSKHEQCSFMERKVLTMRPWQNFWKLDPLNCSKCEKSLSQSPATGYSWKFYFGWAFNQPMRLSKRYGRAVSLHARNSYHFCFHRIFDKKKREIQKERSNFSSNPLPPLSPPLPRFSISQSFSFGNFENRVGSITTFFRSRVSSPFLELDLAFPVFLLHGEPRHWCQGQTLSKVIT